MKKIFALLVVGLALSGCAEFDTLTTAITSSVTPTEAIVAANAFDAAESGATAYLVYCKSNKTDANCSSTNRRSVISYTRQGRAARNQVETYVQSSTTIPSAIYNTLITATTSLKSSPAASYTGAQ